MEYDESSRGDRIHLNHPPKCLVVNMLVGQRRRVVDQ